MRILSLPVDFVKTLIGSKRFSLLVIAVVSAMAILLAISISVAKRSSAHGVNSAKKEQQLCCVEEPVALRRMIGTYYNTKGDWESELVFNNQGPNQIVVTPILYSLKGTKFTASPISIGGESIHELDLNDLVLSAGPQFAEGSYEFTYTGHKLEMSGGLKIMNKKKSLIFDEQMSEPGIKFASPQMEAVYALPYKSAQASLILTNTSERQIVVVNGNLNTWLNAHETQIIHLKTKDEDAGAVSLNHNGGPGALLAMIHVQESSKGFSAAIGFNDPSKGASNQLHGAGLKIGKNGYDVFTPIIAVRNIGKDASSVTGNIPYTTNGKTDRIRLSELSLSPGEVGFLVAPIQWRQISAASAGLEVEYSGAPGSVIASVISVSQSGDKVFPLMMKDPEAVASSSGGYPWFAEDGYSSVVYIKNVTDKPQTFVLDVKYRQGMWGSGPKTVPPGETYVFDVKQARDSQIKGSEGNTIPLDAENGHIYWTIYGTIEKGLIGRSEAVYAYGGMAQTYECQPCPCPASTNSCMLEPPSLIGVPGDSAQLSFLQRTYNCHGAYGSWFPVSVNNFASDNPSVASITSAGFSSALSPGTANFSASAPAQVNYWNGFGCATQYINAFASAVCDVNPQLQAIDPQRRVVGSTGAVHLTGRGFGNSPVVNVGGGITASVQSASDTLITVDFSIVGSATPGNHAVTVTSGGRTSNSINFFVQIPSTFNAVSAGATDLGCGSTAAGYGAAVTYQVMDQEGIAITSLGMTPQETVSTPVGGFTDFRPFATPPTTNSAGRFLDTPVGTCFGPPIPSTNVCLSPVIQRFNIKVPTPSGEATFPITTETRRIDCKNGIRIDVVNGTVVQSVTLGSI